MRRFLTTIKTTTCKAFVSETNYLSKLSHAHANNTYNDDDKAIAQSLKEQKTNSKIKLNLDNEWLTQKSEAHAFAGVQDEIIKSLEENNPTYRETTNTGC